MAERTLGDVPGIDSLLPSGANLLPSDSSVIDVDQDGNVVGNPLLQEILYGAGSTDPFALTPGFLDQPQQGEGVDPVRAAAQDPMASSHLPTYFPVDDGSGVTSGVPDGFDPGGTRGDDHAWVGQYDPSELMARAQEIADARTSDPFYGSISSDWSRARKSGLMNCAPNW